MLKTFPHLQGLSEFLSGQTTQTRSEVEDIRHELMLIRRQLKKNLSDERLISQNISQAKHDQDSFRVRFDLVSRHLASCKLKLASFHS